MRFVFLELVFGGKEENYMKSRIEYTDAPPDVERALDGAKPVFDFLPPPEKLVLKKEKQKVTIMLSKESVEFFKRAAKENGVKYQTMINNLLDSYARHHG
jgi:uncharacterized protein (DUF4415 family)